MRLFLLITWNLILFDLIHGPQKPLLTIEEYEEEYVPMTIEELERAYSEDSESSIPSTPFCEKGDKE